MPDNQFSVRVPNVNEAFSSGAEGYSAIRNLMQERQVGAAREEAAKSLMQGGNPQSAIARLMSVGDLQGAHTIAGLSQNNRDFEFRQQEATRAQGNADRSFGLQQQTANTAQIVTAEDASGNKTPIRVDRNGVATAIQVPGAPGGPGGNPYAYGKQNEAQSKDSGYANRMFRAEGILRDPKIEGSADKDGNWVGGASTDFWSNIGGKLPGYAANYMSGPDFQKFDQARRDFVNAVLRRESGAAISASEFDNATKQYFPQPGDSKEKIAEKRKNRQDAIAGVAGGGGQHYLPPFTFDQTGNMVPTGNPRQGAAPTQAAQPQAAQGAPVKISSAQERDSLPPGTSYIAPDGSLRTKQ